MNRGIAKRTLFETEADIRHFLSRVAHAVRRGEIEVHAFCILTTHFHMLVRSPAGALSQAMRRIQNDYVRRFNRTRHRDGPLVRGRYRSRHVGSVEYRRALVRYIDRNPVSAGLVRWAWEFPHGSAQRYVRGTGPPWLERTWVEGCVRARLGSDAYSPDGYVRVFGGSGPGIERLVERRIRLPESAEDPLDELLRGADERTLAWMRRKARTADATEIGIALVDPETLEELVATEAARRGAWVVRRGRKAWDGWRIARAALLRDLCAATYREVASRTGQSRQGALADRERHERLLADDPDYANRVAAIGRAALERCHGRGEGSP